MCLIFFAVDQHPRYRLLVAANRDEFYQRPTRPMDFWAEDANLLAGRDLQAEGTWLGVSRHGRFAFVTNYRDPANIRADAPSRGKLVSDFLQSRQSPEDYIHAVASRGAAYNGYNLVVGAGVDVYYHSNYAGDVQRLERGLYGLSNALLETPWPKLLRGKQTMQQLFSAATISPNAIFEALYDGTRAPDSQLPNTGIGLERERALSSMFIKTSGYGTRCSTVLMMDRHDHVEITERTYNLTDFSYHDQAFQFEIQSAPARGEKEKV